MHRAKSTPAQRSASLRHVGAAQRNPLSGMVAAYAARRPRYDVWFGVWVSGSGSDLLGFDSDNMNSAFVLDDVSVTSAPEPSALALFAVGMLGVGAAVRRRKAG